MANFQTVEFFLSIIKIFAIIGFIILGIIIDCGGVKSDPRGYIGGKYWYQPGAFRNGFQGFCSVFVTAAFAFGGTELVGLAAAEAADPRKTLPTATKQVFWRITFFYVISLLLVGLIVPSDNPDLLNSSGANTKYSPFIVAIQLAGIQGLPSVFNAVITLSVISVANSCTFASTRTIQALALNGMCPKAFAYVDKKGRPIWCIVLQILFGLLAFINEAKVGSQVFNWLLALSGLSYFFVWASICLCHIRFRKAWRVQGHTLEELPYQASFGVIGSYLGLGLNFIALAATFYTSLYVSTVYNLPDKYSTSVLVDFSAILASRRITGCASLLLQLPRCTHRHRFVFRLEGQVGLQGPVVHPLPQHGLAYRHEGTRSGSFTAGAEDAQEPSPADIPRSLLGTDVVKVIG